MWFLGELIWIWTDIGLKTENYQKYLLDLQFLHLSNKYVGFMSKICSDQISAASRQRRYEIVLIFESPRDFVYNTMRGDKGEQ